MSAPTFKLHVLRGTQWQQIDSTELLPGDIVSLVRQKDENIVLPADMLLLKGSCILNEAILSGESTPQMKESVDTPELQNEGVAMESPLFKNHLLFAGTRLLQTQHTSESSDVPDGGCIAFVLRTGFGTTQGGLVRTMVFKSEHVSANSWEAFGFILFLLFFAILAAGYVWHQGMIENKPRGKLLLQCIMILTSCVPPELPMELSLAVNQSLMALAKLGTLFTFL